MQPLSVIALAATVSSGTTLLTFSKTRHLSGTMTAEPRKFYTNFLACSVVGYSLLCHPSSEISNRVGVSEAKTRVFWVRGVPMISIFVGSVCATILT